MHATKRRRQVQEVWYQLSGHTLRLAEQLDYYERRFGTVFVSQETLANRLKVSTRTIQRGIRDLKELGLLAIKYRKFRNALGQVKSMSNVYKLLSFVGAKIRSILNRLTGTTRQAGHNKTKEKEEPLTLSFVQNERRRQELERFAGFGKATAAPTEVT